MSRFKEAQCSVQTKNTDSKVRRCIIDSGTALTVFLEAFAEPKKYISFKLFLNHVTKKQQPKKQQINCRGLCEGSTHDRGVISTTLCRRIELTDQLLL